MPQEQPYESVLEGGGGLEDVPAGDVAAFIAGVVRLVSRAAGHAVGRPIKETGRRESIGIRYLAWRRFDSALERHIGHAMIAA